MTSYITGNHLQAPRTIQARVLMRAVEQSPKLRLKATSKAHTRLENFSCLESADPHVQIRAALKQVESLLQQKTQLVQMVLLLDRALSEARSLIEQGGLTVEEDRDEFYLSPHYRLYIEQLRKQL